MPKYRHKETGEVVADMDNECVALCSALNMRGTCAMPWVGVEYGRRR